MNKAINCMFIILAFVMCISCGSYNTATMYADADTISIDGATRCDSLIFSDFFKAPKVKGTERSVYKTLCPKIG